MIRPVKILTEPIFSQYRYDLSGKGFLERILFLLKNPPRLILRSNFVFRMSDGNEIVIPSRFSSDCASVPRIFWAIPGFSPYGVLIHGAVPHDFAYQYGFLLAKYEEGKEYSEESILYMNTYKHVLPPNTIPVYIGFPQSFFDKVMLDVCTFASPTYKNVPKIAYKVLRLFGRNAWDKYRKNGPSVFWENSLELAGVGSSGHYIL